MFSLFSVVCSRPKALYHGRPKALYHSVLDTKSSLAMCAVQNYFFTVYCGQIFLFLSLPRERETFYHCPKFTIHLVRKCSNMCLHSPRSGSNETAARQQLSHPLRFLIQNFTINQIEKERIFFMPLTKVVEVAGEVIF